MAKATVPVVVRDPNSPLGNPQYAQLNPQDLTHLPLAQYHRDIAGNAVNTQSMVYYDTAVIAAGTAVTRGMKQALFTKGKNEDTTQFNTTTQIGEKGEYLTNMITGGEFEGGTTFILEAIGVQTIITADAPTTEGTSGEITAPNYTASVVISAANNLLMLLENLELQYVRNEDIKRRAPLLFWGSPYGLSGAYGSPNGGFVQNGSSGIVQLARPVVLQSEDRFSFVLSSIAPASFTPTRNAKVRVTLHGQVIKTFVP